MSDSTNGHVPQEGDAPTALAVRPPSPQELAAWTPRFAMTVDEAVAQLESKRDFYRRVMHLDEHYGPIPGTEKKDKDGKVIEEGRRVLLKPGAELLLSAMGLRAELVDASEPVLDLTGATTGGEPFISFRRACIIWKQVGPRTEDKIFIARAEGLCHSWEKKYRTRRGQLLCPDCQKPFLLLSKDKPEYFCWRKKGGCGATFPKTDQRITSQSVEDVPNPDVHDLMNTLLKMADKRAMVAATLIATGCSDIFTQDVEDVEDDKKPAATVSVVHDPEEPPHPADSEAPVDAEYRELPAERAQPAAAPQAQPAPAAAAEGGDNQEVLIELAKSLPANLYWNKIKVEAKLKSGQSQEQVRDTLFDAHKKAHGDCDHIMVAAAAWK